MPGKWEKLVEEALRELRSETRTKEMAKIEDEVFDRHTMKTLSKLISAGHIDTLDYPISTGKEANVFRATTPEGAHLAVKIYRVHTSSFQSHAAYIWGDPRFKRGSQNKREIVSTWAMKEFKNLSRFLDAGLRVPTPITVKDNVLLMEFVGRDGLAAPLVKNVRLDDDEAAFEILLDFVDTAWNKATLVHGDLSEYNVLAKDGELIVIDTAQSVVTDHPRSRELLERDVGNLVRYFDRKGITREAEALVEDILADDEADADADEPDEPGEPDAPNEQPEQAGPQAGGAS